MAPRSRSRSRSPSRAVGRGERDHARRRARAADEATQARLAELETVLLHIVPPEGRSASAVDVVVSGGGLRGYYVTGALNVLRRSRIRVRRFAGASAGAWCAAFFMSGCSTSHWAGASEPKSLPGILTNLTHLF